MTTATEMNELKDIAEKQTIAVTALRAENEKLVTGQTANEESMKKANDALDTLETKNSEFAVQIETEKKLLKETEKRLQDVEKKFHRIQQHGGNIPKEESEGYKACIKMIRYGEKSLNPEEMKLLRTDSDPDGGFLVTPEITQEILKKITEISPMRSVARVMTTSSKSVIINTRQTLLAGDWVGERKTSPVDSSTYGEEEIPVNKLMVEVIATIEMIQDSFANIVTEITTDATESFAQTEGAAFVNGDANKKPQGFTQDSRIQRVNSGNATLLTADSIIQIAGELKTGYAPVYLLNRRTIAAIRLFKADGNQFLWQPGLSTGSPAQLNGVSYVETPDMDDVGAGLLPVAYGDFNRGYRIVDHSTMSVVRDEFTFLRQGKVSWVFMRRVGGQVVLPEALKLLVIAA